MNASIELQVISKILTSDDPVVIDTLCDFDESFYSILKDQAKFLLDHRDKYGDVPDVFTFQAEYPDITLVTVSETIEYLSDGMRKNKQRIMLVDMFNKIKDLGTWDVGDAWDYIEQQCDEVSKLSDVRPLDLVHDAERRSQKIVEYSKRARIPTGFAEIDTVMYGGFSTVEELVVVVARTNTGKSWVATEMMESAQKNGFPVLYYSPEMQSSFLGTRFDTWRGKFKNSQLIRGVYSDEYRLYISNLADDETPAFVLEDSDVPNATVSVPTLKKLVKKYGIKLLIVDGLSYMEDVNKKFNDSDSTKYKNLCSDLFRLSKQLSCAVVVMMQANRETRMNKDDKGDGFPNIYNIEGSDHPGRIATQVFSMRQIFDKHVLDIRLEKARNASNQKPTFSYVWDIDTGNMSYIQSADDIAAGESMRPTVETGLGIPTIDAVPGEIMLYDDEDVDF